MAVIHCVTNLTILPILFSDTVFATACDSFIWNGNTYSTSGIYIDTLQTISGCDSIVTLNLTINNFSSLSLSSTDSLICYGDSIQLIASGAQSYSWQTSYSFISSK